MDRKVRLVVVAMGILLATAVTYVLCKVGF